MNRLIRILTVAVCAVGVAGAATEALSQGKGRDKERNEPPGHSKGGQERHAKKHKHENGKGLIGDKIKQNGRHKFHQNGKFAATAEVNNGKIRSIQVSHADRGEVPVKKYKSSKKMAELTAAGGIMPVNFVPAQYGGANSLGEVWIGYSYYDDYGDEVIYWYPYEMIEDPWTGAIEYVPVY
ncbi:MAG TPA: hypothetical protein VM051_09850 [Usitatibacter sp.]|nr:hypothetical protein [Usitatibacter sp.]